MSTIADLLVKISADSSGLRKELNATKRQIRTVFGEDNIKSSQAMASHLKWLVTGFAAAGVASIKMAADMEQTTTAFETLLGSTAAAKSMVKDLSDFAARTPFQMPGITKSAQQLLAYGFKAESVIPMLTSVGNAISSMGGNEENMQSVIRALGQIQAKGKLSAEEMMQLSEQGINAWKYLADAAGISIGKIQSLATKGAVSAKGAIQTILSGMNAQFAGGMDKQSQTINGLLSTIKDNVVGTGRVIGNSLSEAFDLKDVLKNTSKFLTDFATLTQNSGLGNAMKFLVPDSVKVGLLGISSVITARLCPSLAMATTKALAFRAAILGLPGIVGAVVFSLGFLVSELTGTTHVMENATKELVDSFKGIDVSSKTKQRGTSKTNIRARGTSSNTVKTNVPGLKASESSELAAYYQENAALKEQNQLTVELAKNRKQAAESLLQNSSEAAAKKAAAALKKQQKAYERLKEKAKDTSDNIADEWVRLTGTQMDVLDKWYADTLAELNKSKSANENYQRDLTRLEQTYSEKRRQIMHEEAREKQQTFEQISNGYKDILSKLTEGSLSGSALDIFNIRQAAADDYKGVMDYFSNIASEYDSGTVRQKANIIASLNEIGIAYKTTAQDTLDFSESIGEYKLASDKQLMDKENDYLRQCKDIQADIEDAYNKNSLSMFKEVLTEKNAAALSSYNAMQDIMHSYYDNWLASHISTTEQITNIIDDTKSSFQTLFSDILTGAESFGDAFQSFFEEIWSNIVNSFAEKWSANITNTIMSSLGLLNDDDSNSSEDSSSDSNSGAAAWGTKTLAMLGYYTAEKAAYSSSVASQTAASAAAIATISAASAIAAKALLKVWAPVAEAVSLATFGANAVPAAAGISAVHALASSLWGTDGGGGGGTGSSDATADSDMNIAGSWEFASGGHISGPGTSKSDSIPAMLSNGEYVINAGAVKKLGVNFLDKINLGHMPALADGGLATGPSLSELSGGFYINTGPSLADLSFKPKVLNIPAISALFGGGKGGGDTNITVEQHNYGDYNYRTDVEEVGEMLGDAVLSALKG